MAKWQCSDAFSSSAEHCCSDSSIILVDFKLVSEVTDSLSVRLSLTRNVLLSAQMGERASVVLICIITSRYNEVK